MVPERHRLLVALADIVAGDHAATIATGLDRTLSHVAEIASHAPARSARQALLERLPKLRSLANDIDPKVRAAVPLVTTVLPEGEAAARPVLEACLPREREPELRASLLLGIARLDRFGRRAASRAAFSDPSPLVAGAARLGALAIDARALSDGGALGAEHQEALIAFIRCEVDRELFPWHEGRLAPLVARYLADCLPDGALIAGLLLARLVREAGVAPDPRVATWADGAVRLALTGANRRRLEALDERQWQVIADVSRRDIPEIDAAWRAAGIPTSMAERRTLAVRHRGRL